MEHDRNFKGVQFERYRKKIDPIFGALHDELEDCYYQYWKRGVSRPFKGFDVQATPEESKRLFDKLHGYIAHQNAVAIDDEHKRTPKDEQDPKYESRMLIEIRDEITGEVLETKNKVDEHKARVTELESEGIIIATKEQL